MIAEEPSAVFELGKAFAKSSCRLKDIVKSLDIVLRYLERLSTIQANDV